LECTSDFPASLTIRNADIIASGSWGLYADPQGCTVDLGANVRFIQSNFGETNLP